MASFPMVSLSMTPLSAISGLKRRYLAAMAAVGVAALAAAAVLILLHSAGTLGDRWLGWLLFADLAIAAGAALVLIAMVVDSFVMPLHSVAEALAGAARGEFATALDLGGVSELHDLGAAVESMRTSLRSSTIPRDYLDRLLAGMGEALLITAAGKIERANAAATELFGLAEAQLVGRRADDLIVSTDRRQAVGGASRPREGTVLRQDGSTSSISYTVSNILGRGSDVEGLVYAAHNIDERKRVEQRIRYLARTDPLTKTANSMRFQHLLPQGIARARRTQQSLAIVSLDVARFKDINDTFGHGAGDTSLEIF